MGKKAEQTLQGIAAAPGLASGEIYLLSSETLEVPRFLPADARAELDRLEAARRQAALEIDQIQQHAAQQAGEAQAALFEAHKLFLEDVALIEEVEDEILKGVNAEAAWMDAVEQFAGALARLPDPTLSERAADVIDVGRRVLRRLLGRAGAAIQLDRPVIVVARDLEPSQTALLDKHKVLAFCTALGGPTSHTAILAKAIGIPAVVGLGDAVLGLESGAPLLVDGAQGLVVAYPEDATRAAFEGRQASARQVAAGELAQALERAVTQDGRRVEVVANIGSLADARAAVQAGAEGVGLLRTEFLFLNRDLEPDEDEQVAAYRAIFEALGRRPVVVRTLDAGGDKPIPYLDLPREANPFLGLRAIRLCLQRPELFMKQLRALLRAGVGCDLRIMFPMIATLEEIRQARQLLARARSELAARAVPACDRFETGMMVEIPSAVWMAEAFAAEVDFFSIGTNDLTQYTFAAERTNQEVAYLADACHPAILRQIQRVVQAARGAGRWVGVCGELAGDAQAIPILVGLGVDELSMAPASIPHAKAVLRSWSYPRACQLAEQALRVSTAAEVRQLVKQNV